MSDTMVTNETLAAILQRVEDSVADLHRKVERLDNDVRANYVTRVELDRYVRLERYIWVERINIAMVGLILMAALGLVGNAILSSLSK
jgi:hypothetical protein